MKTRCPYCGKTYDSQLGDTCPNCQHEIKIDNLSDQRIHELHQSCHNNIRKYTDMKNNALTFIVIGSILLIVGMVFLFLSFRFNVRKERVFTPSSTEFVVCVVSLAISLFSLAFGTVRLCYSFKEVRQNRRIIQSTELKR